METLKESGYKPVEENLDLNEVFCIKTDRIVNSGELVNFKGYTILLEHGFKESLFRKTVEIREYSNGDMNIFYQGNEIEWRYFSRKSRVKRITEVIRHTLPHRIRLSLKATKIHSLYTLCLSMIH